MKHGLVMEGGAMRGLFTAGVIDVMMEEGIGFDGAIGVSAGAVFGSNYKSNQPGRVIRYNLRFCQDPRYSSFRSLAKTGDLFGADFCYREIPDHLDPFDREAYESSPMDFYVVATDVHTGKPVYHNCRKGDREDLDWFRASASMPLAARIVEVGGYQLLDGGISDSIPLKYLESVGYDRNVVILTQPMGYEKKKNKALPLMKAAYSQYPDLLKTMARRQGGGPQAPACPAGIFAEGGESNMTESAREACLQGLATEWRTMTYTWRDCALYALAVGAGGAEPQYTYERDMQAIPTFGATPYWGTVNVTPKLPRPRSIPVLVEEILKPEQSYVNLAYEFLYHRPIPPVKGSFVYRDVLTDLFDRGEGRGMAVRSQVEVFDEGGTLLCTNRCTTLFPTLGGYGGRPMPRGDSPIPDRPADLVERDHIGAAQNLLYRLTGDTNLVHVDRAVAVSRGLDGPFVHDL